jgi:hypothetical protein
MERRGSSLVGALALGAAVVVALLGGLSAAPDPPARRPTPAANVRIGVYDARALALGRRAGEGVASIARALPAIAQRAGVVAITARTDFHADGVELVDVTGALAAALDGDARPR